MPETQEDYVHEQRVIQSAMAAPVPVDLPAAPETPILGGANEEEDDTGEAELTGTPVPVNALHRLTTRLAVPSRAPPAPQGAASPAYGPLASLPVPPLPTPHLSEPFAPPGPNNLSAAEILDLPDLRGSAFRVPETSVDASDAVSGDADMTIIKSQTVQTQTDYSLGDYMVLDSSTGGASAGVVAVAGDLVEAIRMVDRGDGTLVPTKVYLKTNAW